MNFLHPLTHSLTHSLSLSWASPILPALLQKRWGNVEIRKQMSKDVGSPHWTTVWIISSYHLPTINEPQTQWHTLNLE